MIGPKQKISRSRGKMKTASAWRVDSPTLSKCSRCGELKIPHRACAGCGTYRGKTVISTDT